MVIDCRIYEDAMKASSLRLRPFLDGREILKVWYADTDEGLVKTFAIHQFEGCVDFEYDRTFDFGLYSDWELETHDELVSRTIRGTVELRTAS